MQHSTEAERMPPSGYAVFLELLSVWGWRLAGAVDISHSNPKRDLFVGSFFLWCTQSPRPWSRMRCGRELQLNQVGPVAEWSKWIFVCAVSDQSAVGLIYKRGNLSHISLIPVVDHFEDWLDSSQTLHLIVASVTCHASDDVLVFLLLAHAFGLPGECCHCTRELSISLSIFFFFFHSDFFPSSFLLAACFQVLSWSLPCLISCSWTVAAALLMPGADFLTAPISSFWFPCHYFPMLSSGPVKERIVRTCRLTRTTYLVRMCCGCPS